MNLRHDTGVLLLVTAIGCASREAPRTSDSPPARHGRSPLFEFDARIDPVASAVQMRTFGQTSSALAEINLTTDGMVAMGEVGTSELAVMSIGQGYLVCDDYDDSVCLDVRYTSFYDIPLYNVYVAIGSITPAAGHGALNDDPNPGLDNTIAGWSYGDMAADSNTTVQWIFGDNGQSFVVSGAVFGEWCGDGNCDENEDYRNCHDDCPDFTDICHCAVLPGEEYGDPMNDHCATSTSAATCVNNDSCEVLIDGAPMSRSCIIVTIPTPTPEEPFVPIERCGCGLFSDERVVNDMCGDTEDNPMGHLMCLERTCDIDRFNPMDGTWQFAGPKECQLDIAVPIEDPSMPPPGIPGPGTWMCGCPRTDDEWIVEDYCRNEMDWDWCPARVCRINGPIAGAPEGENVYEQWRFCGPYEIL